MSDSDKKQYEYTTQFFGTQPDILSCYVTGPIRENALVATIDNLVKSLNDSGFMTIPEENAESFKADLLQKTDKTLTKLDAFLTDKIFRVPDHVLLPQDQVQKEQFSEAEIDALKQEIEKVKQDIKNEKYMQAALAAEMEEIERSKKTLEPIRSGIEAIKNSLSLDEFSECLEQLRKGEIAAVSLPQPCVKDYDEKAAEYLLTN